MSEPKPEERSWQPDEGDAAIVELRQGIQRLKGRVEVFRTATALGGPPAAGPESPDCEPGSAPGETPEA